MTREDTTPSRPLQVIRILAAKDAVAILMWRFKGGPQDKRETTPVTDKLLKSMVASAKRALANKDNDAAEAVVSRLLDRFPQAAASHGLQLELLLSRGQTDEAARLSERLITQFPSSPGVLFQAGMAAFHSKRYGPARRRFEESEKLFSAAKTRRWLAKTLINMGRFDDAEGLLLNLVDEAPQCRSDLAWLYERKGDMTRARQEASRHLERYPDDQKTRTQMLRLDADTLEESEVIDQVELLDALGEAIPDSLVPRYVRALVAVGRGDDARRFIDETRPNMNRRVIVDVAWTCHRLQLHDVAYELFVLVLEHHLRYYKLLNTLDFSAKRSGRVAELTEIYERLAPNHPEFYGRIKRLQREDDGKR